MRLRRLLGLIVPVIGASIALYVAEGQTGAAARRVGVIYISGHHQVIVDGFRQGLRDLKLEEGRDVVLDLRPINGGDWKAVGEAARSLEQSKVDVIYTVTTQVTLSAKGATSTVPIVFYVGVDPVTAKFVESFAKPGGRLSGVHSLSRDLTMKRMEILKEIVPKLRRVVTFLDSHDTISVDNARVSREVGDKIGIQVVERRIDSPDELRAGLQGLTSGGVQAYFHTTGGTVTSQATAISKAANAKKLPSMFHDTSLVAHGALAAYGHNYFEAGRLSARLVQRVLAGVHPKDLPVENYDKVGLALNLRTAREIGLTIPPSVRYRADQIIQ